VSRIIRSAGHWAARLLPADRRDWAEALWAEAGTGEALLFLGRVDLGGEEAQADLVGAVGGHAGPS
jgi:hypothetical protein